MKVFKTILIWLAVATVVLFMALILPDGNDNALLVLALVGVFVGFNGVHATAYVWL